MIAKTLMTHFDEIKERATENPVIVPLPKLAQFYLDDFNIYSSVDEFHRNLYDPTHLFEYDVIIDADEHHPQYERLSCEETTIKPQLNSLVDWSNRADHQRLNEELIAQSEIKEYILDSVTTEDLVILIVVDGLSYESVRNTTADIDPVLVDGITTTELGYRRVIYGGDDLSPTSIYADLLSEKKFYNNLGFTYWERGDEELSTELHSSMSEVNKISSFGEVIDALRCQRPLNEKTYVQITRMGLDQESHNRKEEPNKSAVINSIYDDLERIQQAAQKLSDRFSIFLTADHGILWRNQLPVESTVVTDKYHHHARFVEEPVGADMGRSITRNDGSITTGLAYPYLARELQNTEWGVHGGFSYHESVVPLIKLSEKSKI